MTHPLDNPHAFNAHAPESIFCDCGRGFAHDIHMEALIKTIEERKRKKNGRQSDKTAPHGKLQC